LRQLSAQMTGVLLDKNVPAVKWRLDLSPV